MCSKRSRQGLASGTKSLRKAGTIATGSQVKAEVKDRVVRATVDCPLGDRQRGEGATIEGNFRTGTRGNATGTQGNSRIEEEISIEERMLQSRRKGSNRGENA